MVKPNFSESIVNLSEYSFISNSRSQTQGGGVGFYVKENLVYSTPLELNRIEEKFLKSLLIDVKFKNKAITFGYIYRAPCNDIVSNSSFLDILNNTLKRIKKRDCFLLGDFNYNILDCEKPQISDFVDQMFYNFFCRQRGRVVKVPDSCPTRSRFKTHRRHSVVSLGKTLYSTFPCLVILASSS